MASFLRPVLDGASHYRGLEWIFEYTNADGALSTWNCGQAAAATFLTHHGKMDPLQATRNMAWLEEHHPPDQLFGWFGTGRRRIERIMRSFQFALVEVHGREGLERELDQMNPVMLMLGMSGRRAVGVDLPSGHWMVAYGCDARNVYLTNGWPMLWTELQAGWRSIAGSWIGMNGRGLALPRRGFV